MYNIPINVSLIITQRDNSPAIELRRATKDLELIKIIISSAFHERPLLIMPCFNNKMHALSTLIDKGILGKNKNDEFIFLI